MVTPHIPMKVWQEVPGEVSWRCSCGMVHKHQPFGDLRCADDLHERAKSHPYGFGIVDKDGNPWWDEACVCEDRDALEEQLVSLNDEIYGFGDERRPYRVVRLVSVDLEAADGR